MTPEVSKPTASASFLHRVLDRCRLEYERRVLRSFGLNRMDVKLRPFLDFDAGTFVEAGAFDGVAQSNTMYLERYRGWRGLLIEPVPEHAEACRRNRPRSHVEEAALVSFDFPDDFVQLRACSLMSVVRGGMKSEEEENAHVATASELLRLVPRDVRARARPLSAILNQCGITDVDFLSLDVEGFELSALRGLDLTLHRPALMLIEARYREDIDAYLARADYEPIAQLSELDVLYRRREPAHRSA